MVTCIASAQGRRRLFWSTQPEALGREMHCQSECGIPGLSFTGDVNARGISNSDWVRGLAINMLMTDGREDPSACGWFPGSQGGHWSESFMTGPTTVGTLIRTVTHRRSVSETTALIRAYALSTMERLITRGVAVKVTVEATYRGNGNFELDIEVFGTSNDIARVGLSGERLANGWVWK